MKLLDINWNPSDRQLRQFGVITLVALPFIGSLWHLSTEVIAALTGVGVVAAVAGLIYPRSLRYVFIGLTLMTFPIGLVVSEVMLLVSFVTIFVPLGLAFRWLGRDALRLRPEPAAASYWLPKQQPAGAGSYLRQW